MAKPILEELSAQWTKALGAARQLLAKALPPAASKPARAPPASAPLRRASDKPRAKKRPGSDLFDDEPTHTGTNPSDEPPAAERGRARQSVIAQVPELLRIWVRSQPVANRSPSPVRRQIRVPDEDALLALFGDERNSAGSARRGG